MDNDGIFYIMKSHLTNDANLARLKGELEVRDINESHLVYIHKPRFSNSDTVIFKESTRIGKILGWKTTLVKGDEIMRSMVDDFPMVDIEPVPSSSKLYKRGDEIIGYFDSHDAFITSYKEQLGRDGESFAGHHIFEDEGEVHVRRSFGSLGFQWETCKFK